MTQQTPAANRVVDPILSEVVRGYKQPTLVGSFLFPRVSVPAYGGKIIAFGKEDFRRYNLKRAPGTNTKRVTAGHEGQPYAIIPRSVERPVPRELGVDAQAVPGVNLGTRASLSGMRIVQNDLEFDQAELATDAANYGVNNKLTLTLADRWTNDASDPSGDIETGREAIRSSVGHYPNIAVVSAKAMSALRHHPKILDRTKYTSRDSATPELLAALWDIDQVVVGGSVQAGQDDSFSDSWGDGVVLAYSALGSLDNEEPSYGYTYYVEGHPLVEVPYWDSSAKAWIYGVSDDSAPVIAGADAGFLISGAGDAS